MAIRILDHLSAPCKEEYVFHLTGILNEKNRDPMETTEHSTYWQTVQHSVASLIRRHYARATKGPAKNLIYITDQGLMAVLFRTDLLSPSQVRKQKFQPKVAIDQILDLYYSDNNHPYKISSEHQRGIVAKYHTVMARHYSKWSLENNWFDDTGSGLSLDSLSQAQREEFFRNVALATVNDSRIDAGQMLEIIHASNGPRMRPDEWFFTMRVMAEVAQKSMSRANP
ncbi:MAG TPA: hypothetical protein VGQ13_10115 [Nitrososphaera sp.]|nr:hypothetical protein [Nitrososphaera sp.]